MSAITQLQFRLIDVLLNFYSTILRPTLTTSAVTQITMAPAKRSSALRYMGSAMELSPPSWWFLYLLPSSLCCSHFSLENRINKRYLFSAIASLPLSVITTVIIRIITLFLQLVYQEMLNNRLKLLEGNLERLNPNAPLEEQLDLLPYDSKYEFSSNHLVLGDTRLHLPCYVALQKHLIGLE